MFRAPRPFAVITRRASGAGWAAAVVGALAPTPGTASGPEAPPAAAAAAAPLPTVPPLPDDGGKAAYLLQLLGYVEWPPAAFATVDAPTVVGVVGAEPVAAELQRLAAGRPAGARPVQVRRLQASDPVEGLHALFLAADSEAGRREWTDRLGARPVLVVTERSAGLPAGAMLNLVTVQGRRRFEASPETAERAGLRLSSRLLAVAERLVPAP